MKSYLSIPNWEEFQHYKDRNPPWIKLHNQLLENYDFECLPDASKAHLLCIWLLASRTENKFINDSRWIGRKIGANTEVNIKVLVDSGFLQLNQEDGSHASNALQTSEQDAGTEGEGEQRESKEEKKNNIVPYKNIKDEYNKILFDRPRIEIMSDSRKTKLKSIWNIDDNFQSLKFWSELFEHIRESDFLMGKTQNYPGCNFDFILQQSSFIKIYEGFYHQETNQGQR